MKIPRNRSAAAAWLLWAVFVWSAVVCAQAMCVAELHAHPRADQHCCALCHVGSLPFVPSAVGESSVPTLAAVWLQPAEKAAGVREILTATAGSRAPPAYGSFAL